MASPDNVIRVPKPARESYNPDRPLARNALLQAQVKHFHHVEQRLPRERQTGIDVNLIQTEGEASAYIRKITAILHPQGAAVQKVRKAP
jgi:hypothetical protein